MIGLMIGWPARDAPLALVPGAASTGSALETTRRILPLLGALSRHCQIPTRRSELGVPASAVPRVARGAMKAPPLLVRNVSPVNVEDAMVIYRRAFL